ncbi:hypothetical protein GCM10009764_70950 [Nocardia ninae]|uniref:Uncharacterized protein n=1 Tax=Nocardia ninae NBRC 108245 TaxID=1210091 RepID=A0A511MTQ6_9NOCA|nr:hypothetical protein NN4_84810 [Nocardia ninae NBRC 108245]
MREKSSAARSVLTLTEPDSIESVTVRIAAADVVGAAANAGAVALAPAKAESMIALVAMDLLMIIEKFNP